MKRIIYSKTLWLKILAVFTALAACHSQETNKLASVKDKKENWVLGLSAMQNPNLGLREDGFGFVLCNFDTSPQLAEGKHSKTEFAKTCVNVFVRKLPTSEYINHRFPDIPANPVTAALNKSFMDQQLLLDRQIEQQQLAINALANRIDDKQNEIKSLEGQEEAQKVGQQELDKYVADTVAASDRMTVLSNQKTKLSVELILAGMPKDDQNLNTYFQHLVKLDDFTKPKEVDASIIDLIISLKKYFKLEYNCRLADVFPELIPILHVKPCATAETDDYDMKSLRGTSRSIASGSYEPVGHTQKSFIVDAPQREDKKGTKEIRMHDGRHFDCDADFGICTPTNSAGVVIRMIDENNFEFVNTEGERYAYRKLAQLRRGIYEAVGGQEGGPKFGLSFFADTNMPYVDGIFNDVNYDFISSGFRSAGRGVYVSERNKEFGRERVTVIKVTEVTLNSQSDTLFHIKATGQERYEMTLRWVAEWIPSLRSGQYYIDHVLADRKHYFLKNIEVLPYRFKFTYGKEYTFTCPGENPLECQSIDDPNVRIIMKKNLRHCSEFSLKIGDKKIDFIRDPTAI